MSLKKYHQKRDFAKTPEPEGKVVSTSAHKGLYVIQKHAARRLHYDFRLELNGVLLSWAVPKGPCLDPSVKRLAMHVEDHPLEYGNFEGIIPKGQYGGGTVMLWDKGTWFPEESNPSAAYKKGSLTFVLNGEKLQGRWKLIRINKDDKTWLLFKIKDEYARSLKDYAITEAKPNSVVSQQSLEEIAKNYQNVWQSNSSEKKSKAKKIKLKLPVSPFPEIISPQLATLVNMPPEGEQWLHEVKFDGYRFLAIKQNNKTRLISRNQKDWTPEFDRVVNAVNQLKIKNIILDGEIVILDEHQRSNFQLLQNSIKSQQAARFIYYVFDLLYYDKYNLMELPLHERKDILRQIVPESDGILRYSEHIIGSGPEVLANACELKLEGIVSKQIDRPYFQGRTRSWLKSKCNKRQEFVIAGFTPPQGSRGYFGSLLLGTYDDNHQLIYRGRVGTGFTESSLQKLHQLLLKNKTDKMPFQQPPPESNGVTWVKPKLAAEVEFSEWTNEGYLRHPSFKGLRSDKATKEIKPEIPMDANEFKITNPNKILYPEKKITKQQLIDYYLQVEKWIMPYVADRPLTLVRCPQGYDKECFYQKHINNSTPSHLYGVKINSDEEDYIYIKDKAGLIALPQLGVLEIHPWGSRVEDFEHPDILIFDLDPAPGLAWKKVVAGAFELREHLKNLDLISFVKTTGGKGLHVVVPIMPKYDWSLAKDFTHAVVNLLVAQHPKKYIDQMSKIKRTGKIFIDYLRNQRGATAIAPYSTRARKGAPVSTPLEWDELTNDIRDTAYNIKTLPQRLEKLKKDPWTDFFKIQQSVPGLKGAKGI